MAIILAMNRYIEIGCRCGRRVIVYFTRLGLGGGMVGRGQVAVISICSPSPWKHLFSIFRIVCELYTLPTLPFLLYHSLAWYRVV